MNVLFNPAMSINVQHNNTVRARNNVKFTGLLGDKFVRDITLMGDVTTEIIMNEIKGPLGPKTKKVQDVIESFVDALRNMTVQDKKLEGDLKNANNKIAEFPKQKQDAVSAKERELRDSWKKSFQAKNEEVLAAKAEAKAAKEALEKYKPVVNVKSVQEVVSIMPERAIEVMNEMVEHKVAANKSMFDFLMNGKGQEEALAQIERNNTLMKAQQEGIMGIPSVEESYKTLANENSIWYSHDSVFTMNLIEKALKSDPKGEYLASRVIREQVKKNAMALLTPMADERYVNTGIEAIETNLDKTLDGVIKFHDGFKKGLEKLKKYYKTYEDFTADIKRVDNDVDASKITSSYIDSKGIVHAWDDTFEQIANYGNSSW